MKLFRILFDFSKKEISLLSIWMVLIIPFIIVNPLFSQEEKWNFQNRTYTVYNSENWTLVTDLPKDTSLPILEYTGIFSQLVYEFISDWREESPKLNGRLIVFSDCIEYQKYLRESKVKGSFLFFRRISQVSWSDFTIAGCFTNFSHFSRSFQNEVSSALFFNEKKIYPSFLLQGFSDYFAYSQFIADDLSIIPYPKMEYITQIKKYYSRTKMIPLEELMHLNNKDFYKKRNYTFPQAWFFISFLMDRYPDGRTILKEYYREFEKEKDPDKKIKSSFFQTFRNLKRANIQDFEKMNKAYSDYLEYLEYPTGYEGYKKSLEYLTFSSKKEILEQSIGLNPNYSLYSTALAKLYYSESMFPKSLEFAERSLEKRLTDTEALKIAIYSLTKIQNYSKAEYYVNIYSELRKRETLNPSVLEEILNWRKENPEIPRFLPPVNVLPLY